MNTRKMALPIAFAAIGIAAAAFSGCNGKKENAGITDREDNINLGGTMPIIKDASKFPKLKMAVVVPADRILPTGRLKMVQKLKDSTGVEFDWQEIPTDGAGEKLNLMLASGQALPDAFWNNISGVMIAQYMDQGVFLPTEELIDKYMPRLKAIYERHPEYKAAATAPDGHMYGFPYIEEMKGLVLTPGPFIINTEWLAKTGKPMPKTIDEFTAVLRAFRDAGDLNGNGKDDEIPYALDFTCHDTFGSYNTFHQFTGAFGQADSYCGGYNIADHMRVINDAIVFTAMDPAYRETAQYFNMLKRENLLDIDSFSPGPSAGQPLFVNKIKGSDAVIGVMGLWAPANEITDVTVRAQYRAIPRMTGAKGKTGYALNFSEMQDTSMVTITTDCKYPEVIAAFVDQCFEPEISITLNWGAEGYIYEKGDDGKLHFRLDESNNIALIEPYKTFGEMRSNTTPARGSLAVLNEYYDTVTDYTWDAIDLLEGQTANGKYEVLAEYTPVPKMILSSAEQTRISQIQPVISDIVQRYTIQWVLDGTAETTWDAYLAELKAAGVEDLLQTFQGAYNRFVFAKN
ncbi:MAG: extracellular solute-binding protein [Treponema sp.]|jgi:putative aldouronate transport system substrate-binding protein|nr:extracellular solute-binding protein [Treponema sp.]